MKIAKIIVGIFLVFAAYQGILEDQNMFDLECGALFGFILMIVAGIGLLLWGLGQKSQYKSKTD